ncbi:MULTISPECIES: ATP-grasp domain-containing protein [unclassified Rummeliibacillus]|uniref:ATP-grasp domain-containing protein n=1 Tax=unclassified Rummeliibacillus TaxID=2622809 RepID=UPI000E6634DD|nr:MULTISPECIES: ATP-grasp domain-containing protein [unclassified Rummeliibacillus]RIJ62856.1 ATP-grasp domain-containing protein [Rummeliibacillus sp. POC4]RPJ94583.1 ATP-grasp domain-containing protein [Rummeliibacillus sp. TYF005]
MEDKHILFFNATYIKKILTLETAKRLGLKVSVVGPSLPEWSFPFVDHFIEANTYDINETISILTKKHTQIHFDGVITFWDRDVVPVAVIAQEFGLKGSSVASAVRARNKGEMRECLRKSGVPHPKFKKFSTLEELKNASKLMDYPLIVKPVGASASKGVFKVTSPADLENIYDLLIISTTPNNDAMFSFYPNEYLVEEFMEGQEISVEGIISNGNIHFAGITEKWTDYYFEEYQHAFPARVSEKVEKELLSITENGIHALGLDNCGFHAEIMMTKNGYKIVEINGRLGGDFITTHLIPLATGIDITEANLLAAIGEEFDFTSSKNKGACVKFLTAEVAGTVHAWEGIEKIKEMPGVVDFVIEKQVGDYVGLPPDIFHDSRIAYVITVGENTDEAINFAINACSKVRCNISEKVIPGRNS